MATASKPRFLRCFNGAAPIQERNAYAAAFAAAHPEGFNGAAPIQERNGRRRDRGQRG